MTIIEQLPDGKVIVCLEKYELRHCQLMLERIDLSLELHYNPLLRHDTKAGYEPITGKQQKYLASLSNDNPELWAKIERMMELYWFVYDTGKWLKSDAGFAISVLKAEAEAAEFFMIREPSVNENL